LPAAAGTKKAVNDRKRSKSKRYFAMNQRLFARLILALAMFTAIGAFGVVVFWAMTSI
jgi:hypothetical protein